MSTKHCSVSFLPSGEGVWIFAVVKAQFYLSIISWFLQETLNLKIIFHLVYRNIHFLSLQITHNFKGNVFISLKWSLLSWCLLGFIVLKFLLEQGQEKTNLFKVEHDLPYFRLAFTFLKNVFEAVQQMRFLFSVFCMFISPTSEENIKLNTLNPRA